MHPPFRSQIFKIFFASGGKGGGVLTPPPNHNPADIPVLLLCAGGQDASANVLMFKQRSHTDYILLSLPVWPDGLTINDVPLTTSTQLGDTLNALRGRVSTLSVDFHDVLDFYNDITKQFMYWLLVIFTPTLYYTRKIISYQ